MSGYSVILISFVVIMVDSENKHEICIVGGGPAGASAALYLGNRGYKCLLIDKAEFPRDKVCGDALSGKVLNILKRIDPSLLELFYKEVHKSPVWGIRFVAPNKRIFDIPFRIGYDTSASEAPGYVCKRIEFDNFLISNVRKCSNITLREGIEISEFIKDEQGYTIKDKNGKFQYHTKLLLVANGAHSRFSRINAGLNRTDKHTAAGVKVYVKNLGGLHEDGFIEMHFTDSLAPGYLWAFRLPDNESNVGLGLRSDIVKRRKLKLRQNLLNILNKEGELCGRLDDAKISSNVEGFPLPLGSKIRNISGNHFMLLGDAAHLVDPLTGEGIGNGMYSGWIAAEQAIQCLLENRFDEVFMRQYDQRIKRVLGTELRLSYTLQRLLKHKNIVNFLANRLHNNIALKKALCEMYTNLEYRKQLSNPLFWIRLLFKIN